MNRATSDSPDIWQQAIVPVEADIDVLGHVNNVVYVRWAQDLATAHWMARAPQTLQARVFWVVTRHEIDYRAEIRLGDAVTGTTWVDREARGVFFGRTVEIHVEGRAKPAATIRSQWCLMAVESRKMLRVGPDVLAVFWPDANQTSG